MRKKFLATIIAAGLVAVAAFAGANDRDTGGM